MRTEPPQIAYPPNYGPSAEWANLVALEAQQNSVGQIGASVRGLAVEPGYELVVVHACVSHKVADDLEDLQELVDDMSDSMEPFVRPLPRVELRLHVGETDASWSGRGHRMLYLMHWRAREGYVPE
jgi:hypothetical protein